MTTIAGFCMLAHGWRRIVLLVLAGGVAGLSAAPLFILPALFLAMPIWIWTLDGAETGTGWRRLFGIPFAIGFWFGLGYFLVALHWIGAAFFVDGGWVLAAMPFCLLALTATLALFWGFASAVAHLLWSHRADRVLALAVTLTIAEFARGHLFTGFPFDLLGYALTANDQMMQAASAIGVYGLTLVAVLVATTPALIWPADKRPLTTRLAPFFAALAIIAVQVGYGQYRLGSTELVARTDMRLRLVQPVIDQSIKWQADSANFVLDRLFSLSEARTGPADRGLDGVTHLVWPETALPVFPSDHPETLARIARMLPDTVTLLTGMPWRDPEDPAQRTDYNAVLAIDTNGEIVASYYKTHLVPFGEYLPFANLFAGIGITQFVPGNDGWTAGSKPRLLAAPGTPPILPLVCYEAIFSADLGATIAETELLLNLTNDAWFDGSLGPAQHFHHARLRAVEEGKPMIRVANSGISAMIDPLGRAVALLAPGEVGVLDVVPERPLAATPFATYRHWPLAASLAALLLFELAAVFLHRRKS